MSYGNYALSLLAGECKEVGINHSYASDSTAFVNSKTSYDRQSIVSRFHLQRGAILGRDSIIDDDYYDDDVSHN
jgi:hypothetical protein